MDERDYRLLLSGMIIFASVGLSVFLVLQGETELYIEIVRTLAVGGGGFGVGYGFGMRKS